MFRFGQLIEAVRHELSEKKLNAATRGKLPVKDFAEPKKRAYPDEDRRHGANALSRVSQNGSSAEKRKVRSKVCAKYPNLPSCKGK